MIASRASESACELIKQAILDADMKGRAPDDMHTKASPSRRDWTAEETSRMRVVLVIVDFR